MPYRVSHPKQKRIEIWLNKIRLSLAGERYAFFIYLSIAVGALAFLLMAKEIFALLLFQNTLLLVFGKEVVSILPTRILFLLAIVVAFLQLPKVFEKVSNKRDVPKIITFAEGFRDGYFGVQSLLPSIFEFFMHIKQFWRNLEKSNSEE